MMEPLPGLARPFVGIRPFERNERSIFFGRDRDARLICDKIFASRLTLFYGPSGVGKSSLLCTLVMPELEAQNARTLYYDAWSAENPLEALKEQLVDTATAAGVADAGAGAPSLANLVAMLNSVDGRTVVLVLDQFEELLAPSHAHHHKRFRRELLRLVRAKGPDVRVVLSLREEHLASLEPLREDVLQLYMSTYRLEMLDDADLRKAIQGPAAVFGAEWEPKLVEDLIKDLQALGGGVVELPMLQLVCDQLWTARRSDQRLSVSLYEWLGRAPAILDEYVRGVMPSTVQGRLFTAKLMVALAPRSGFKAAYTPTDLSETCGLPLARVSQDLERLSEERILRTRRYRSSVLYELQHDALIPIIGKWRDEVMERRAARKSRRRRVAVLLFVLLAFIGRQGWGPARLYQRTKWVLSGLAKEVVANASRGQDVRSEDIQKRYENDPMLLARVERTLDDVGRVVFDADDYLGGKILAAELEQYGDLVPQTYGRRVAVAKPTITADATWPIILKYSSALKIDRASFNETWRTIARHLAELRGIPIPEEIDLQPTRELPRRLGQLLVGDRREPLELPTHDNDIFIPEAGLTPELRAFLDRIPVGERVGSADEGGPWRFVPRWSLPVWKASGTSGCARRSVDRSAGTGHHEHSIGGPRAGCSRLHPVPGDGAGGGHPERALGTGGLGERTAGPGGGGDVVEAMPRAKDDALAAAAQAAAEYPASTKNSMELAWILVPNPGEGPPPRPVFGSAREPAPGARVRLSPKQNQQIKGFERSTGWLPPSKRTVTCFIGAELRGALLKDGRNSPAVDELVSQLQGEEYRRFGVRIPSLELVPSTSLPPNAFQFEFPDEEGTRGRLMFVLRGAPAEEVVSTYRWRAEALRERWVTAEAVSEELQTFPGDMQAWVAHNYSITDLKVLLRSVVRPSESERQQRRAHAEGSTVEVSPNSTIYPLDWLLGSLVFWSQVPDRDLDGLTKHLRDTQSALDEAWRALPYDDDAAPREIVRGVAALENGQPAWAQRMFEQAFAQSPETAARWFLEVYARHRVGRVAKEIQRACANPLSPRMLGDTRLELGDYLAQRASSEVAERKIRLCQFSATPRDQLEDRQRLGKNLVEAFSDPEPWPVTEAAGFGQELLAISDPLAREKPLQEKSRALLISAFGRTSPGEAEMMFQRILAQCHRPGPHYMCRSLLEEMANQRPEPNILFDWLVERSTGETEDDLEDAVKLADRLDRQLHAFPNFLEIADQVGLARATAELRLADLGHEDHRAMGEQIAQGLTRSVLIGGKAQALLVRSATAVGDYTLAKDRLTAALEDWSRDPELRLAQLSLSIKSGQLDRATLPEEDNITHAAAGEEMDGQCLSSMAQVVIKKEGWSLAASRLIGSKHPCRRLLTLLLYAQLGAKTGKDQHVLDDAWSQIKPESWPERLRGADGAVWYEMLVGYYTGEVKRTEIFDPLKDDRAFASSALRFLRRPRRWLSCEAHFYEALLADTQGDEGLKQTALKQLMSPDCRSRIEQGLGAYLMYSNGDLLTRRMHPMP